MYFSCLHHVTYAGPEVQITTADDKTQQLAKQNRKWQISFLDWTDAFSLFNRMENRQLLTHNVSLSGNGCFFL